MTNIEDLVAALSLRIDELDEEDLKAANAPAPRDEMEAEAMIVAAAERKEKRTQLEQLRGNVTTLADNLQTLVEKAKKGNDGDDAEDIDESAYDNLLLISEDMEKIESVITETATMLMMLTQSEAEEEVIASDDLIQEDEQGMVVEDVVRFEDQMSALDAMASSVELLSLADELLGGDSFEGIEFTDLKGVDLQISPETFVPEDASARPEYWKEVRNNALFAVEFIALFNRYSLHMMRGLRHK